MDNSLIIRKAKSDDILKIRNVSKTTLTRNSIESEVATHPSGKVIPNIEMLKTRPQ